MSFFNLSEPAYNFETAHPDMHAAFFEHAKKHPKFTERVLRIHSVKGFEHPQKGQCYEIVYQSSPIKYSYNATYDHWFLECHYENGQLVVDNFGISGN